MNVLQIWDSPDKYSTQLANIIAVNFVVGSSFYVCGSIPYTYDLDTSDDNTIVFRSAAIIFVIGSTNYLTGGMLDGYRYHYLAQMRKKSTEL